MSNEPKKNEDADAPSKPDSEPTKESTDVESMNAPISSVRPIGYISGYNNWL